MNRSTLGRGRWLGSIGAMVAVLLGLTTVAAAAPQWKSASWGRAWVTLGPTRSVGGNGVPSQATVRRLQGKSDDILEDGHCVYLRTRLSGQSWPGTSLRDRGTKSCGAEVSFTRDESSNIAGVRLYRDDGRYLTLWGT